MMNPPARRRLAGLAAACLALAACGGGNPLDNPPLVANPPGAGGQKLSFAYFQKCIDPVLQTPLQINVNGERATNTCAASGCHDNTAGTGGALRIVRLAPAVDLANPANTPDVIRTTDMYKNFYSAQGEVVFSAPMQSRLLTKPLVLNVLHGGGLIFASEQDPNVKLIRYWISRPMLKEHDEFSSAANSMFDPVTGQCKSE